MSGAIYCALVALALYVSCTIPGVTDQTKVRNGRHAQIMLTLSLVLAIIYAISSLFSISL